MVSSGEVSETNRVHHLIFSGLGRGPHHKLDGLVLYLLICLQSPVSYAGRRRHSMLLTSLSYACREAGFRDSLVRTISDEMT